ncbi:MAG TPA: hypothetical protein VFA61_01760 [Candidatus Udaeobacter sp.]|nr:hypothetical protein [Candidatus Udaeobacter sp.]
MRAMPAIAAFFIASTAVASEFDGAWVLSGQWTGYMGLALKIRGDHYKYWFSSDVGPTTIEITDEKGRVLSSHTEKPPRYPLTGRAGIRGDTLELRGPGEYYDRKWRLLTYRGVPCLLAEQHYREWKKTGKLADDRLLFRAQAFDEKHPRLNYGGVEQPDGSVTRTSPLPPK